MCSEVLPHHVPILELGPGTGVFTRELLARGVKSRDLLLIEHAEEFIDALGTQFPGASITHANASDLAKIVDSQAPRFGAVISGLPLRAMAPSMIEAIISAAFAHMAPGAALYQFTYGWRNPVPDVLMKKLGLQATCIGRVWMNLPSAAVYRIVTAR